jgi:hypothetical protein
MGRSLTAGLSALLVASLAAFPARAYDNFHVAIYCRAQEVQKMADPKWLADSWDAVSRSFRPFKMGSDPIS